MPSILSAPYFHDEQAAYDFIEARIWAKGRVCPKCGTIDQSGKLNGKATHSRRRIINSTRWASRLGGGL